MEQIIELQRLTERAKFLESICTLVRHILGRFNIGYTIENFSWCKEIDKLNELKRSVHDNILVMMLNKVQRSLEHAASDDELKQNLYELQAYCRWEYDGVTYLIHRVTNEVRKQYDFDKSVT